MEETMELHCEVDGTFEQVTRLLTVCIPTYNRRKALEECLASVLPQADALGVGVCVSDNGSSDGTWQALEILKLQYPWMQIMRHTRDIGPRDNLTGAVLSSRAQYVWTLGDKLVLLPGALEFVVAELVRLHPDAVVVNSSIQDASTVERICSSPQSCLTEVGWYTTLCGATVLPRQAWVAALRLQPVVSRDFSNVVVFFSYLASLSTPQVLFSGRVLVQAEKNGGAGDVGGTHYWSARAVRTWGREWYDAVMSLPALYSVDDKLQVVRSYSEHTGFLSHVGLMRLRAQGQVTLQQLSADQVPLRVAISAPWWSAVIISVVPRWMLRPVLYVHPRLMLRAMRRRLRLLRGQQSHRSAQ